MYPCDDSDPINSTREDMTALRRLARILAVALENALEREADREPLLKLERDLEEVFQARRQLDAFFEPPAPRPSPVKPAARKIVLVPDTRPAEGDFEIDEFPF